MFGAQDDDDLDFNPAASSKLASLFGLGSTLDKGNASLTYTAPKQPKPRSSQDNGTSSAGSTSSGQGTPNTAGKLALIVAKVVHSFKLEDGNYNPQGKLGAAVVGNATSKVFKLILYKGKQQQITTARITSHFQFTVQPNLYASFYDDHMQNWSVNFETSDDAVDFARQLGVARYRAAASSEQKPLSQGLSVGEGPTIKEGDTLLLKLAAQQFSVDNVQTINPQHQQSTIETQETISDGGWSAGLLAAKAGSCQLLLLPLGVTIPWLTWKPTGPVLIEATIGMPEKVREPPSKNVDPVSGPDSALDSSNEDSSIRARGVSIKEALTHSPRSTKASIISRMARMGQATLPLKGAIACNPSDSEETEEEIGSQEISKPPLKTRPSKARSSASVMRQQTSPLVSGTSSTSAPTLTSTTAAVTVVQAPAVWSQQNVLRSGTDGSLVQYISGEGQLVAVNTSVPPQQLQLVTSPVHSPPDPQISVFLSEARTHNSEVRMNISKVSDKVEQLMAKMDALTTSGVARTHLPLQGVGLEPEALLTSIQKLVTDNQTLQTELTEKNKRLDEQNERIFSLLSANSKYLEQSSSFLEHKQQQQQQQQENEKQQQQQELQQQLLKQALEEKNKTANQLADTQSQLAGIQDLVHSLQQNNSELTQKLETITLQLKEKENELAEAEKMAQPTSGSIQNSDEIEIERLATALKDQERVVASLRQQMEIDRANHSSEAAASSENLRCLTLSHQEETSQLLQQVKEQEAKATQHQETVSNLLAECNALKKRVQKTSGTVQEPTSTQGMNMNMFVVEVKSLMNTLYRALNHQFTAGQTYDGSHVRAVIASTIKGEALRFVEQIEALEVQQVKQVVPKGDTTQSGSDSLATSGESVQETSEVADNTASKQEAMVSVPSVVHREAEPTVSEPAPVTPAPKPGSTSAAAPVGPEPMKANITGSAPDIVPVPGNTSSGSGRDEREPSLERSWRPQPPPPPLFDDEDDSDDWLA